MMDIQEEKAILHTIDDYLADIGKHLSLHTFLTPTNLETERAIFLERNGDYDPQFTYRFPDESKLRQIIHKLKDMKEKYFSHTTYTFPISHLLKEKIEENILKAELLIAYLHQDFSAIERYNALLFGPFDPNLLVQAEHIINTYKEPSPDVRGRKFDNKEVIQYIEVYLKTHDISGIQLKIVPMSINKFLMAFGQKGCYLILSQTLQLREKELEAHLIHELDVHYQRYQNGKSKEWKILAYGTSGYAVDEEGFALYEMYAYKRQQYPQYEKRSIYDKYVLLYNNQGNSFSEIAKYIQERKMSNNLKKIFLMVTNMKKGIQDTSRKEPGVLFIKNKIYVEGLAKIRNRIAEGNDKNLLYQGKIKIKDLIYIKG